MPTANDPLAPFQVAQTMLECVEERLEQTWGDYPDLTPDVGFGPAPVPRRSCVIDGEIAWSDCECGQLVVAITDSFQSRQFPTPIFAGASAISQSTCGAPLIVFQFIVNILRCAPTGPDTAAPPSCENLSVAAQVAEIDAYAVRTGIQCCLRELSRTRNPDTNALEIVDFAIGVQARVGPAGGCQGSEVPVSVALNNVCPCGEHGS